MPIPGNYVSMFSQLVLATNSSQVNWTETTTSDFQGKSVRSGVFRVELESGRIEISKRHDEYSGETMVLEIREDSGGLLDRFEVSRGDRSFSDLNGLYDSALYNARGMRNIVDRIEKELGGGGDRQSAPGGSAPGVT